MRMKKFLAAVLVVAMGATLMFGCGSKNDDNTSAAGGVDPLTKVATRSLSRCL